MRDLNDMFFFSEVVANGGFAPAGRVLRQSKSKLSRRVARLEERLGVRLIERSSRRFRVTDVGQAFYDHCQSVMAEVNRAEAVVAATQGEPHGTVRFNCPQGMMDTLGCHLVRFMERYPRVNLQVVATNRRVDLIAERIDLALRVSPSLDIDASFTVRKLTQSNCILVAAPVWADRLGDERNVEQLASLPTLSINEREGQDTWALLGPEQRTFTLHHMPRLSCGDCQAVLGAAIAGLGITLLPEALCGPALRSGQLVRVFPDWHTQEGILHLVFTSRRGLPPPVSALIEYLAEHVRNPFSMKMAS
ncbi:Transcriptional regulator, LysR family [Cystobacter fuscus DSM 2262]|uniref:Transcriptional regulator, LysR family n=1 Tax=Cystobacter fuscus (strain ATCC 25194 / DSM 2262 / NBRC 100088 / M29) TaxID=1242864 RepID=S9QPZ9_CYSF2|nr:LysR substrate-binding domain-containing protein [Cystobacter fuscus]EPX63384.1 Transcriptional regulator, LysR family [Cystobacter fuscus DSM 2262]